MSSIASLELCFNHDDPHFVPGYDLNCFVQQFLRKSARLAEGNAQGHVANFMLTMVEITGSDATAFHISSKHCQRKRGLFRLRNPFPTLHLSFKWCEFTLPSTGSVDLNMERRYRFHWVWGI